MLIIFIRTFILYFIVLLIIRMMGKSELSELEPFQLVVLLIISELAATPMGDSSVPLIYGVTAFFSLFFFQVLVSILTMKSKLARTLLTGKPSILIDKGKINEKELEKLRINMNDLTEQLRAKDYASLDEVEYAILETNGELTVIPKPEHKPVTLKDLNIFPKIHNLTLPLIVDGVLYESNLEQVELTEDWLKAQLAHSCIEDYSEIVFCYIDEIGKLHVHRRNKGESN
ncbi:MAG: DUF421 domain-containing protein [Peptostreptococcales bacterium]